MKVKYLPTGWLVFYYKPSNGFHYMSNLGRFFNSIVFIIIFIIINFIIIFTTIIITIIITIINGLQ